MVFNKEEFLAYYNSIENESDKISWCRELMNGIDNINFYFDDLYCDLLFKKYNLYSKFQIDKYNVRSILRYLSSLRSQKFSSFKYYLQEAFLPFIRKYIEDMDFKLKLTEAEQKYPNKFESNDEKFPVFDYDYDKINLYAERIFKLTKEKIEYFSYIIMLHSLISLDKMLYSDRYDDTITKIKITLQHLKTVYDLEIKNTNLQIPENSLNRK